jgi:hypothetical protein
MAEAAGKNDRNPLAQQVEVIEALMRLAASLKELNDKESAPILSHFRNMPEAVSQSYDLLEQGASLVHGTSTKYTLLGKLDVKEQTRMTQDLLNGCQLLATGCVVLHDNQTGCARSTRQHCKQAARSIVHTVIQLVQVWVDEAASGEGNNLGAQKTGAVWEMCDKILQRKLPKGNRSSMRRDLLTYMRESMDTIEEFQEIVDAGPSLKEEGGEEEEEEQEGATSDDDWGDFLGGEDNQYTTNDLPVATACLFLIKCSRGCLNLSLQAIEAVGEQLAEQQTCTPGDENNKDADKAKLVVISRLHDLARLVGDGMTDLGASMYPPLQLEALEAQVVRQADAMQAVLDLVMDGTLSETEAGSVTLEFPEDVNELLSKVREALQRRREESLGAIEACSKSK